MSASPRRKHAIDLDYIIGLCVIKLKPPRPRSAPSTLLASAVDAAETAVATEVTHLIGSETTRLATDLLAPVTAEAELVRDAARDVAEAVVLGPVAPPRGLAPRARGARLRGVEHEHGECGLVFHPLSHGGAGRLQAKLFGGFGSGPNPLFGSTNKIWRTAHRV